MALPLLLDENVRGQLWQAILRHNEGGVDALDVTRVGDPADLPLGADDPQILVWAEREGRILVCLDQSTMQKHLNDHMLLGRHSPGVLTIRPRFTLQEIIEYLVVICHASDAQEWVDRIAFFPQ